MKIGIDCGNGFVKFNGERFASQVEAGTLVVAGKSRKEIHQIKYNGKDYIVGQGGKFLSKDRYFTEYYKMCLLTAIALASKNRENTIQVETICVGLPINFHEALQEKLKKHIESWNVQEIEVNGTSYVIEIKRAIVFPEGAFMVKEGTEKRVLTIDIGSGTVNVIQWENGGIKSYNTYTSSFYSMLGAVAKEINKIHTATLTPEQCEKYIGKKVADIDQEEKDISFIEETVKAHISGIASQIATQFELSDIQEIKIFGGGAISTFTYWKNHFKKAELVKDSQFVNSEVFNIISKVM